MLIYMPTPRIILGSRSEGRKKVLESMGYTFDVLVSSFDEKSIRNDDPYILTLLLAQAKADALLPAIHEPAVLITSDQVVVCNKRILEKPENPEDVATYFVAYQTNPAETVTSVVVTNTGSGKKAEGTDVAKMWWRPIPQHIINEYIATGDCYMHAGGFASEHPLLVPYTDRIEGEPESIIGLPKALTKRLIESVMS
jgi:septum formation protein